VLREEERRPKAELVAQTSTVAGKRRTSRQGFPDVFIRNILSPRVKPTTIPVGHKILKGNFISVHVRIITDI
jgi:hypothetical protein